MVIATDWIPEDNSDENTLENLLQTANEHDEIQITWDEEYEDTATIEVGSASIEVVIGHGQLKHTLEDRGWKRAEDRSNNSNEVYEYDDSFPF